jgi:hypothetical protein
MSEYDARDVLDQYVKTLRALGDAIIRDAGELSHPKDIIKFVLRHCIRTIEDPDQRKFLRDAYLSLASFQALSDDERKAVTLLEEIGPLAPSGDERHEQQAARIGNVAAALDAVIARVKTEALILAQDLRSLPSDDSPA